MKLLYKFLPLLAVPVIFILLAPTSGSPGGYSGSPGDGGLNCTSCHAGTPQNVTGWITTNIPQSGYQGGQTYTLTLNASHATSNKFGFELTAEDLSGNKVGTLIITNSQQTKLVNNNKSVTHTSAGTSATGGNKSWSFNWTAPEGSAGAVRFYAAVNATNNNGTTSGDVVYLTNFTVYPDVTGIEEFSGFKRLYPNPAKNVLYFKVAEDKPLAIIRFFNLSGHLVYEFQPIYGLNVIPVEHLPRGVYLVHSGNPQQPEIDRLILQ